MNNHLRTKGDMNIKELEDLKNELLTDKSLEVPADKIIEQIKIIEKGIPYLKLVRPCVIGDGVKVVAADEQEFYITMFNSALDEGRVVKFVPGKLTLRRLSSLQVMKMKIVKQLSNSLKIFITLHSLMN